MAIEVSITTTELSHLLRLLTEYTAKLREICEERATGRYRLFQSTAVGGTAVATALYMFAALFTRNSKPTDSDFLLPATIATVGAVVVVFIVLTASSSSTQFRHSYDAKQVASTVELLIKTLSQHSEHASRRISRKFEYDLRLAEAEAALQMYKVLFDKTR